MKKQALVGSRTIVIELPPELQAPQESRPPRALVFELLIDCPDCGQHKVQIAGHHLRTINVLVAQAIEEHPDLCGDEAGRTVKERLQWSGTLPRDPRVN